MQIFQGARRDPEKKIREAIVEYLTKRGWYVKVTHGNLYQSGFPDLYATHPEYGPRWIEVKLPEMKKSRFTKAQMKDFPKLIKHGSPVWIMTSATDEAYCELFKHLKEGNYHIYLALFH